MTKVIATANQAAERATIILVRPFFRVMRRFSAHPAVRRDVAVVICLIHLLSGRSKTNGSFGVLELELAPQSQK